MQYTMNEDKTFGFIWNVESRSNGFIYGTAQIVIGEHIYPKSLPTRDYYTLTTIFGNFKGSFEEKSYTGRNTNEDFGERKFEIKKYENSKLPNIFILETTDMGGGNNISTELDCLVMCMGYSGNTERLFYSFDYGESFSEIRYPKGTVESVIRALPTYKDLESFVI